MSTASLPNLDPYPSLILCASRPHFSGAYVVPPSGCVVLLASDGFWDGMSPEDLSSRCGALLEDSANAGAARDLADQLVVEAEAATVDDVTLVLVVIRPASEAPSNLP